VHQQRRSTEPLGGFRLALLAPLHESADAPSPRVSTTKPPSHLRASLDRTRKEKTSTPCITNRIGTLLTLEHDETLVAAASLSRDRFMTGAQTYAQGPEVAVDRLEQHWGLEHQPAKGHFPSPFILYPLNVHQAHLACHIRTISRERRAARGAPQPFIAAATRQIAAVSSVV
jgi:hypothetical protein